MLTAHFQGFPDIICKHLSSAQQSIRIAVCWFSHKGIFEIILARLWAGVQVELLLEYDSQNVREGGLDFQQFIRRGGHLYGHSNAGLMHHKFALIDERLLLSGSFNWTYNSNAENLLVLDDTTILQDFLEEFEREKVAAKRIFAIWPADLKVFSALPLFENTLFPPAELRKKISGGAGVWAIRTDKMKADANLIFRENKLPFDADGLLHHFWRDCRIWNENYLEEALGGLQAEHPVAVCRTLRCWAKRMKPGDMVLAVEGKNRLRGIGIVQSVPQAFVGAGFSSFREVQWVKVMADDPYLMPEAVSAQPVARFRGSALRVLQEVFEKKANQFWYV